MGNNSSVGKSLDLYYIDHRLKPHCCWFFWYRPLASLAFQIDSLALESHCKNNGSPTQYKIRVTITPWLLKAHVPFFYESSPESAGDV